MVIRMDNSIIKIHVDDKNDIFNDFNDEMINSSLVTYIDKSLQHFNFQDIITFQIDAPNLLDEDKKQIESVIRTYYAVKIKDQDRYYHYSGIKKIILFIIGALLIVLSRFFDSNNIVVISEMLMIAGWVAILEGVYSLLFTDNQKKFEKTRALQVINSKITFKK